MLIVPDYALWLAIAFAFVSNQFLLVPRVLREMGVRR